MEILEVIDEMEHDRIKKHISPPFVTLISLVSRLGYYPRDELNDLYKENKIELHRTINDISIHVKVPLSNVNDKGT